jgi:purine-nucleoside phosphorylase
MSHDFDCAVIAGSGIDLVMGHFEILGSLSYTAIPGIPVTSVEGHTGQLVAIRIGEKKMLVFAGRVHLYEGHALINVIAPIVISALLGVSQIILTNAAGGLNPAFNVGDVMVVSDIINSTFRSVNVSDATRRMTSLLDAQWTERIYDSVKAAGEVTRQGVYLSVTGPAYETKSEIAMFSRFASAIGMSTVHEAQAAVQLGLSACACSVIANVFHPDEPKKLYHSEVLEAAKSASAGIASFLRHACRTIV